jgi:hypothetical protein
VDDPGLEPGPVVGGNRNAAQSDVGQVLLPQADRGRPHGAI